MTIVSSENRAPELQRVGEAHSALEGNTSAGPGFDEILAELEPGSHGSLDANKSLRATAAFEATSVLGRGGPLDHGYARSQLNQSSGAQNGDGQAIAQSFSVGRGGTRNTDNPQEGGNVSVRGGVVRGGSAGQSESLNAPLDTGRSDMASVGRYGQMPFARPGGASSGRGDAAARFGAGLGNVTSSQGDSAKASQTASSLSLSLGEGHEVLIRVMPAASQVVVLMPKLAGPMDKSLQSRARSLLRDVGLAHFDAVFVTADGLLLDRGVR